MIERIRRSLAAVVVLVAPAVVLAARFVWDPQVPQTLPTHWGSDGQVNGTTGETAFFVICLVVSAGTGLGGAVAAATRRVTRATGLVSGAAFAAWLLAAAYVMVLTAAQGATRPEQVHVPWQVGIALLVVAVAAALAVAVLLPASHVGPPPASSPASSMRLRPDERVTWVGEAHSRVLAVAAVVLALAAVAAAFSSWPLAIALLAGALATAWTHVVTVRVDDVGVHTLWGPAGWPRSTIPLSMISAATAEDLQPAQWGGWGYRVGPRGRAAIVRTGDGLVLRYGRQSRYAVTVDHAEAAADVVNALVDRDHGDRHA